MTSIVEGVPVTEVCQIGIPIIVPPGTGTALVSRCRRRIAELPAVNQQGRFVAQRERNRQTSSGSLCPKVESEKHGLCGLLLEGVE